MLIWYVVWSRLSSTLVTTYIAIAILKSKQTARCIKNFEFRKGSRDHNNKIRKQVAS